jgi:hypothetical protein
MSLTPEHESAKVIVKALAYALLDWIASDVDGGMQLRSKNGRMKTMWMAGLKGGGPGRWNPMESLEDAIMLVEKIPEGLREEYLETLEVDVEPDDEELSPVQRKWLSVNSTAKQRTMALYKLLKWHEAVE